MDVIIRRPLSSEKQEIHALFDAVIKHTFSLESFDDDIEFMGELIAGQQALIDLDLDTGGKDCLFLVAQHGDKIIGTICQRPCSDIIIDCAGEEAAGMIEIGSVYILPKFQGAGVAGQLLDAMYKTLADMGCEEFWLDSGYTIAKKIWAKILGKPSIIMKDYWAKGVDHHLWRRKLSEVSEKYQV